MRFMVYGAVKVYVAQNTGTPVKLLELCRSAGGPP